MKNLLDALKLKLRIQNDIIEELDIYHRAMARYCNIAVQSTPRFHSV